MAVGWAREGAVQEQIEATVEDAVQLARSRLPEGESFIKCEECEIEIPAARRKAVPGCTTMHSMSGRIGKKADRDQLLQSKWE
jgi:RNA polymerase-binding transcription factor DksA